MFFVNEMNHNYHSSSCLWLYDRETVRELIKVTICEHAAVCRQQSVPRIDWLSRERWIYSSSCPQWLPTTHASTCSKLQQLSNNGGKWSMKVLLRHLLRLMATLGNAYTHTFTHIRHFPSGGLPKVIRKTSDICKVELLQVSCPWWCTTNWRVSIVS